MFLLLWLLLLLIIIIITIIIVFKIYRVAFSLVVKAICYSMSSNGVEVEQIVHT